MIRLTERGLYCSAGDFYIDPWRPVERAVITHAHADHARRGHQYYYATTVSEGILRQRLGRAIAFHGLGYGETIEFSSGKGLAKVSLHSAGHVLGSAQVRVETDQGIWIASGDYKRAPDPSCAPFEVVPCDTFITESTFALPIFRWPKPADEVARIYDWWQENRAQERASLLFCYAFGKAQRVLAELASFTNDTVWLHGAVHTLTELYREAGVSMVPTQPVPPGRKKSDFDYGGELVIAPPGANGTPWMKRFGPSSGAFCSGWMAVRGHRRRRGYDRGFVISDHADWPSLIKTIEDCQARNIIATHGRSDMLVEYLNRQGFNASTIATEFGDDHEMETQAV